MTEDVEAARQIRLDPDRQAVALRRIATAREVAEHHERQASAARGTMLLLTRTWDLCPAPDDLGVCCGDPQQCKWLGARQATDLDSNPSDP